MTNTIAFFVVCAIFIATSAYQNYKNRETTSGLLKDTIATNLHLTNLLATKNVAETVKLEKVQQKVVQPPAAADEEESILLLPPTDPPAKPYLG